jgi:hypothetical protein
LSRKVRKRAGEAIEIDDRRKRAIMIFLCACTILSTVSWFTRARKINYRRAVARRRRDIRYLNGFALQLNSAGYTAATRRKFQII